MLIYEVHVEHESSLGKEFDRYMCDLHLPQILATGCFRSITFERESDTHVRTRYMADTQADLDRYLVDHTAAFRADFQAHFPNGTRVWREIWQGVKTFEQ